MVMILLVMQAMLKSVRIVRTVLMTKDHDHGCCERYYHLHCHCHCHYTTADHDRYRYRDRYHCDDDDCHYQRYCYQVDGDDYYCGYHHDHHHHQHNHSQIRRLIKTSSRCWLFRHEAALPTHNRHFQTVAVRPVAVSHQEYKSIQSVLSVISPSYCFQIRCSQVVPRCLESRTTTHHNHVHGDTNSAQQK